MLPLADALKALLLLMEAQGYPYALRGALALGVWSQPRGTKDIDVTLWLDGAPLRAALEHLTHQGGRGDVDQALADAQNNGMGDEGIGHDGGLQWCLVITTTRPPDKSGGRSLRSK